LPNGTLTTAIYPCETIELIANGGDNGVPHWTAGQIVVGSVPQAPESGTWHVCAEVNDQGDMFDENRDNNKLSVSFEVSIPTGDIASETNGKSIIAYGTTVEIRGIEKGETVTVYNLLGTKVYSARAVQDPELITSLQPGIYTVVIEGTNVVQKVLIVVR